MASEPERLKRLRAACYDSLMMDRLRETMEGGDVDGY
jgi:hypothetical protein